MSKQYDGQPRSALYHTTDAVPTLAGQVLQAIAVRHHRRPDEAATVCLLTPTGAAAPTQHAAYLDVAAARLFARHVIECAEIAERTNHPQTERQALDEAISAEALDRAVSDLVGLRP